MSDAEGAFTRAVILSGALSFAVSACGGGDAEMGPTEPPDVQCTINISELLETGVGRDNIPALTNPKFVSAGHPEADYLLPLDRVIGFVVGERALAIPHNILWWHEVLNLNLPEGRFMVTYCPLTGSAVAFDRGEADGLDFGVSGLLFRNNLVMFDRADRTTLWPQMMGEGVCGPRTGSKLTRLNVQEMTWRAWLLLYPETEVVSSDTGWTRDYTQYPYGDYEDLDSPPFLPQLFSQARQPKERVMGIEGRDGGVLAVPFLELDKLGTRGAANVEVDGQPFIVFWDRAGRSASTFSRIPVAPDGTEGQPLTFRVETGALIDNETGSRWDVKGNAVSGPLAGAVLPGHPESMVAFWFAWSAFHPRTRIWLAG